VVKTNDETTTGQKGYYHCAMRCSVALTLIQPRILPEFVTAASSCCDADTRCRVGVHELPYQVLRFRSDAIPKGGGQFDHLKVLVCVCVWVNVCEYVCAC
jgi:hypothetical protein